MGKPSTYFLEVSMAFLAVVESFCHNPFGYLLKRSHSEKFRKWNWIKTNRANFNALNVVPPSNLLKSKLKLHKVLQEVRSTELCTNIQKLNRIRTPCLLMWNFWRLSFTSDNRFLKREHFKVVVII